MGAGGGFQLHLDAAGLTSKESSLASCMCFLPRLHRAQCAIKQTQVTVQKIGREIEEKLRRTSTSNELVGLEFVCLFVSLIFR